jgi:hypothetical protein
MGENNEKEHTTHAHKTQDATIPTDRLMTCHSAIFMLYYSYYLIRQDIEEHREAWSVEMSCVSCPNERQTPDISSLTGPGAFLVEKTGEIPSNSKEVETDP